MRTEDQLEVMKRNCGMPTLEIHALVGVSQGPGLKSIVPPRAERKASCRLVPKQDPRKIKKLIAGVKGVYVRNFEFESDGQYTAADIEAIRTQLRGPGWTRMVDVKSKKDGDLEVYVLMNGELVA